MFRTNLSCAGTLPRRRIISLPTRPCFVFRSGFLPRIIGVWLMINCFGYVVLSVIALFVHEYYGQAFNWLQPILFGELAIMLWLLIKGAKVPVVTTTAAAA